MSVSPLWRAKVLLWCIAALHLSSTLHAQENGVHLVTAGSDGTEIFELLNASLQAAKNQGRLPLRHTNVPSFSEHPPSGNAHEGSLLFLVNMTDPRQWTLYLVERSHNKSYVRTIPGPSTDPAAVEALVAIAEDAILVFKSNRQLAPREGWKKLPISQKPTTPPSPKIETAPPVQKPKSSRPPRPRRGLLGARYVGTVLGSGTAWRNGAEVVLGLADRAAWHPGEFQLRVGTHWLAPLHIANSQGAFSLQVYPVDASVAWNSRGPWGVRGLVGVRGELVRRYDAVGAEGQSSTNAQQAFAAAVTIAFAGFIKLSEATGIEVETRGLVFPTDRAYFAEDAEIFRLSRARIQVSGGVYFEF